MQLDIRPLSGALGAEIYGVDLSDLDDATWTAVREAFLRHLVLFFPEQSMDARGLAEAGKHFGELGFYPFIEGLPEEPHVFPIVKEPHETKNFGEGWHSDTTYTEVPPMATMLYAVDVPSVGGDTLFANMYLAYESLSEGMQALLSSLKAVNSAAKRSGGGRSAGNSFQGVTFKNQDQLLEGIHPIARTHPETGRKALYVNALHTARIEGMTDAESAPLLEYLFAHKSRPEFTCRYRWAAGTVAIWDNRAAQHYALNDYHGHRREMLRLSIAGDMPV
ncbi:MAG: taurine dioxygenase [Chromatiales bacterium]|jgi:taurine dioxygenase|nr:taurine dioxygenase [Chromatiales bacterium]